MDTEKRIEVEKELIWTYEDAIKMLKSKIDGSVDTSYEWVETVRLAIHALEQMRRLPVSEDLPPEEILKYFNEKEI